MYPVAISFAAAAIGISCIATNASAGGGGHGSGGHSTITPLVPAGNSPGSPGTTGSGGGGGSGGRTPYYAPASSKTACGYYPYPPCKKVPGRWSPGRSILTRAACRPASVARFIFGWAWQSQWTC